MYATTGLIIHQRPKMYLIEVILAIPDAAQGYSDSQITLLAHVHVQA